MHTGGELQSKPESFRHQSQDTEQKGNVLVEERGASSAGKQNWKEKREMG